MTEFKKNSNNWDAVGLLRPVSVNDLFPLTSRRISVLFVYPGYFPIGKIDCLSIQQHQ